MVKFWCLSWRATHFHADVFLPFFISRGTPNFLVFLSFPVAVCCAMPQAMKNAVSRTDQCGFFTKVTGGVETFLPERAAVPLSKVIAWCRWSVKKNAPGHSVLRLFLTCFNDKELIPYISDALCHHSVPLSYLTILDVLSYLTGAILLAKVRASNPGLFLLSLLSSRLFQVVP